MHIKHEKKSSHENLDTALIPRTCTTSKRDEGWENAIYSHAHQKLANIYIYIYDRYVPILHTSRVRKCLRWCHVLARGMIGICSTDYDESAQGGGTAVDGWMDVLEWLCADSPSINEKPSR